MSVEFFPGLSAGKNTLQESIYCHPSLCIFLPILPDLIPALYWFLQRNYFSDGHIAFHPWRSPFISLLICDSNHFAMTSKILSPPVSKLRSFIFFCAVYLLVQNVNWNAVIHRFVIGFTLLLLYVILYLGYFMAWIFKALEIILFFVFLWTVRHFFQIYF